MSGSQRCDVVLVGGGLVGACLAEELVGHDVDVLVLDAGGRPGHATGQVSGVAVPALRDLHDEQFYPWLRSARTGLEQDIARLEPVHGSFSLARPVLRLLGEADVAHLPGGSRAAGFGTPATEADLTRLAPGLRIPAGRHPYLVEGGLTVNGRSYLLAVQAAAMQAGVRWWQERVVSSIEENEDAVQLRCTDGTTVTAERVVVTAGAWAGQLLDVPITPQRGQLVLLDAARVLLQCIVSGRLNLAPLPGGRLLVGATAEEAGFDERSTAGSVAEVLAFALRLMPELASASVLEVQAGLRPMSASGRPVVGRAPGCRRVYVAAGHSGHGLSSARATARGLASGLEYSDWSGLPADFSPREVVSAGRRLAAGRAGPSRRAIPAGRLIPRQEG
jgi:glycine oxidase